MQDILRQLGDRMRQLRAKHGYSQESFADRCGLHRTAVSLIESGKRVPSLTTLVTICNGFDITLSELLRGVDGRRNRKARG